MDDTSAIITAVGVLLVILGIVLVFSLVFYILRSIGLYTLSTNRGLNNPWIAWIPVFGGAYALGEIADDTGRKIGKKTYYRFILLGGKIFPWLLIGPSSYAILTGVINSIDYPEEFYNYAAVPAMSVMSSLGQLASFAVFVITLITLYMVFKDYRPQSAVAWTVLSVFFQFLPPIFLFVIRNDRPPQMAEPQPKTGLPPYGADQWANHQPNQPQDGTPRDPWNN